MEYLIYLSVALGISLAAFYALWLFYLAVMNLKRARDLGLMTNTARNFGLPILIVGWVLDFILNLIPMTIILLEFPKETTVTARLKRHNKTSTGYRKKVVVWFETLLDPYDPSGDHI